VALEAREDLNLEARSLEARSLAKRDSRASSPVSPALVAPAPVSLALAVLALALEDLEDLLRDRSLLVPRSLRSKAVLEDLLYVSLQLISLSLSLSLSWSLAHVVRPVAFGASARDDQGWCSDEREGEVRDRVDPQPALVVL